MKWVFYVVVFIYMAYRAVYGVKVSNAISVDKISYGNDTFLKAGTKKTINCRATNRNQRLEWIDPQGKVIKRVPTNRVFAQEHFVTNPNGGHAPALVLTFTDLLVTDTGVYKCRSGNHVEEVSLCVIKPSEFVDTPTEITAELGRSITLTCQAKGDPEPNFIWSRNDNEITEQNDSSKYKVNTKYNSQGFESLLTIFSLEPEDSGDYTCVSVQKHPLQFCQNEYFLNITLQVSHAPIFKYENETKAVYGKNNAIVDLVCSATGFPAPTYRWFKAIESDTLFEFDKKQIKYSEEENQAVLSVTASPTTFGQTYKCVATNSYGSADKYFKLYRIQKPDKPSEVNTVLATAHKLGLNVSWYDEIYFPVKGFQIQHLWTDGLKKQPKENSNEWKKAIQVYYTTDDEVYSEFRGLPVAVEDLEEDTSYWIRLRATNDAGVSPWSDPILAATKLKEDEEEEDEVEESTAEPEPVAAEVSNSDAAFYGIFFTGGIIVVAVVCMFLMRIV